MTGLAEETPDLQHSFHQQEQLRQNIARK